MVICCREGLVLYGGGGVVGRVVGNEVRETGGGRGRGRVRCGVVL